MRHNLILFLLFFYLCSFGQDAKMIAKKCLPSTVSIFLENEYTNESYYGSGFIIEKGKVITNYHVIEKSSFGYVTLNDRNKKYRIDAVLKVDKVNDLALLSVPSLLGASLELNYEDPEVGEKIYVIGNPQGLSGTISEGIISGIRAFKNRRLIQITAPISPGSSGGPVITNDGKVIGVAVSAIETGQNLNFAIPSSFIGGMSEFEPIIENDSDFDSYTMYISGNNVNVRSEPNVKLDNVLFRLNYDEKCYILSKSSIKENLTGEGYYHWYNISSNGRKGWVYGQYISLEKLSKNNTLGIVKGNGVNIRLTPDINGIKMGRAFSNEEFLIMEKTKESSYVAPHGEYHWYLVKNNRIRGWIFGKYLKIGNL